MPPLRKASSDVLANISLGSIGVQWHLRGIEDSEQFLFMGAELRGLDESESPVQKASMFPDCGAEKSN